VQSFSLIPYPAGDLPQISICGAVERTVDQLSIRYSLTGDIASILLPAQTDIPTRKQDLWKATCFEFFLALPSQPQYWEFNLSPSGDWNVYRMDAYRQVNMREENSIAQLPFEFRQTEEELSLAVSISLSPIISSQEPVLLGLSAIIQAADGRESYWALVHPGSQPDFHLSQSFAIEL
jgi:hypothetical protein